MKSITESYSFSTNDGRIVLRASLSKPSCLDHTALEFLTTYYNAIFEFAAYRLFSTAKELYQNAIINNVRFVPLLYSLECIETFCKEGYASYLLYAKLSQATNIKCSAIDSVVFLNDQILPPAFLSRQNKNSKLVLDSDGFSCTAHLLNNTISFRRVGKNSVIKQ